MSAVGGGPAIVASDLIKRYRRLTALDGLSLHVNQGSVFGLLGPNGAGKSTTIKLLLGLARQTSGHAEVLGFPAGDPRARKHIGYLPELFRYQEWLTAREVLDVHADLAGVDRIARGEAIGRSLDTVGLMSRADDPVHAFSKGMQQRLGLAVALIGRPQVVFLDEPTSALDPIGRRDVRDIIRQLRQRGMTVFLNSHLLTEVEQVCDSVAVLDHGHVVAEGRIEDLLAGTGTVRLRIEGLTDSAEAQLHEFGSFTIAGDSYTFTELPETRIPDLVALVIRLQGRVFAVEPHAHTLEDRFLALLGESGR